MKWVIRFLNRKPPGWFREKAACGDLSEAGVPGQGSHLGRLSRRRQFGARSLELLPDEGERERRGRAGHGSDLLGPARELVPDRRVRDLKLHERLWRLTVGL